MLPLRYITACLVCLWLCQTSAFYPTKQNNINHRAKRETSAWNHGAKTPRTFGPTLSQHGIHDNDTVLMASIPQTYKEIAAPALQPDIQVQETELKQQIGDDTIFFAVRTVNSEFEAEGYLIQKDTGRTHTHEIHIFSSGDADVDNFVAVFNKLFLRFLIVEHEAYEKERDGTQIYDGPPSLRIEMENVPESLLENILEIGIGQTQQRGRNNANNLGLELSHFVPFLSDFAFQNRGTEQGLESLRVLQMLSKRRVPFNFSPENTVKTESIGTQNKNQKKRMISLQKQLLPSPTVDEVMAIMDEIKAREWLSTNPDSVDGLPSLHLNLVTNGKPLFDKGNGTEFSKRISQITNILQPHLENNLLPAVRKLTNSSTVEISDVFLRHYGHQNDGSAKQSNGEGNSVSARYGLSPHYDVTAYSTCVMTLDSTASKGRNGLYTFDSTKDGTDSSNAALRRFFKLEKGDGVVHTYDILHGVDVDPHLNNERTSLIVWFVDKSPWLLDPVDDTGEFILGLAAENRVEGDGNPNNLANDTDPFEHYVSSASHGNVFALTRLGQMCIDGGSRAPMSTLKSLAKMIRGMDELNPFLSSIEHSDCDVKFCESVGTAMLYQAAIPGGNGVAQLSLADQLICKYMSDKARISKPEQENLLLMASTLLNMASNQGYDAKHSLELLMSAECNRLESMGINVPSDEFFRQPIIQAIMMSS